MSFSMNLYYTGHDGSAKAFVKEMCESGTVDEIRKLPGCLRYDYFISLSDDETVLLIDTWESQQALDDYHASDLMKKVAFLREKYDLHMKAERYVRDDMNDKDGSFIRK